MTAPRPDTAALERALARMDPVRLQATMRRLSFDDAQRIFARVIRTSR